MRSPSSQREDRRRARWTRPSAVLLAASLSFVALAAVRVLSRFEPPPALHLALGLAVVAAALARARLEARAIGIVVGGLLAASLYLSYTGPTERNLDAGPHLYYVRYVAEHLALPPKAACTVCHHPPAYYLVAAAVLRAFVLAGSPDPALGLQLLSLLLFSVFLGCAALTVQRLASRGAARLWATALVAFWPSGILGSVRLGNDVMTWAIGGGVLLCLAAWYQERSARALWGAALLVVLGLATKASAVALALVVAVVALAAWRSPERSKLFRAVAPPVALVLLACALQGVARRERSGSYAGDVLGSAYQIDPSWRTARTARYYLTFDPVAFVATPYATVPGLGPGEPTYWNHLLKSSLLGTRRATIGAAEREPSELARAMNALLLAMLAYLALGQLAGIRRPSPERAFAAVATAVFVAAGLGFHLLVPYGFHADFRFIHPALVPLAVLYVEAAELAGARARGLRAIGYALAALMVALSVAYFVPATWRERPMPETRGAASLPAAPRRRVAIAERERAASARLCSCGRSRRIGRCVAGIPRPGRSAT